MQFYPETYHSSSKILVRAANWIGDAIMTTPALRAIRQAFPAAEITLLAKPWVAPVFEHSPDINDIVIYRSNDRHAGMRGKIRLANDLKKCRFDKAILLQNAIEAALITFWSRIPERIGFNTDGRGFLLTHPVIRRRRHLAMHQIGYYLGMLKDAGIPDTGWTLSINITSQEHANAVAQIEHILDCPVNTRLIVGINPGAEYGTAKRWPPEYYAELCRKIYQKFKPVILIFGTAGQADLGYSIARMANVPMVNLTGRTSLREAMALISICNAFITNDSGLMHVAAALHIPQLAIFGSTNHTATSPFSPKSRIIRVPCRCSPCLKTDCPIDHHCMRNISVDMVFQKVTAIID